MRDVSPASSAKLKIIYGLKTKLLIWIFKIMYLWLVATLRRERGRYIVYNHLITNLITDNIAFMIMMLPCFTIVICEIISY